MYYFLTPRERLIELLPKGATAAEIGVAHGDFAEHITKTIAPKNFHLIDPWSHLEPIGAQDPKILYSFPENNFSEPVPANTEGEKMYHAVQERFKNNPGIVLHRQFSYKLASAFQNSFFDFIYIDGNHNYEFALNDLILYSNKIKPDGLILGHDFFEDSFAAENNYGVIDAVNSFVKRSDFRLIGLTYESFSTFILARKIEGFTAEFLKNCFESDIQIIELPTSIAFNYHDINVKLENGSKKRIPSFY